MRNSIAAFAGALFAMAAAVDSAAQAPASRAEIRHEAGAGERDARTAGAAVRVTGAAFGSHGDGRAS